MEIPKSALYIIKGLAITVLPPALYLLIIAGALIIEFTDATSIIKGDYFKIFTLVIGSFGFVGIILQIFTNISSYLKLKIISFGLGIMGFILFFIDIDDLDNAFYRLKNIFIWNPTMSFIDLYTMIPFYFSFIFLFFNSYFWMKNQGFFNKSSTY